MNSLPVKNPINLQTRPMFALLLAGLLSLAIVPAARAQTESVLYSFTGGADSDTPAASLLLRDGIFYGTTYGGNGTYGTVFEVTKTGKKTLLYAFTGGADGAYPTAGLVADSEGNLYGTTQAGGAYRAGVVYQVTPAGVETVILSFNGTNGSSPYGNLARDSKGNLYGTTMYGGNSGAGTVYKVTAGGVQTVLYNFTGGTDGGYPFWSGVVLAGSNLYGVASGGGANEMGTVFKVTLAGKESVIHSFAGSTADGESPEGTLLRDSKGNLYGTTYGGGANGDGTVFEVDSAGTETLLHSFAGAFDGANPIAGVIRDSAGNLYGTTLNGGNASDGTVYEISPLGSETILHSFLGGTDGSEPVASLVRDSSGNLYGTTAAGGNSNCSGGCGVVFKVVP